MTTEKRGAGRPRNPNKGKQFSVLMTPDVRSALKEAAKTIGKSESWLISECVKAALHKVCLDTLIETSEALKKIASSQYFATDEATNLPDEAMAGEQEID